MAGGRAARRPAGGGDGIQALRPTRPRLTLALAAALAYAGVAAYAIARAHELEAVAATLEALGGAVLLVVLARGPLEVLPWALALGGGAYAVTLWAGSAGVDEGAPLVAAALLLAGELAAWSLDERLPVAGESVRRRRAAAVALLLLGGLACAALVVAVAAAPEGRGLAWTALGAAAAVGVLALVVTTLRPYLRRG